jgi:hypothetical protein
MSNTGPISPSGSTPICARTCISDNRSGVRFGAVSGRPSRSVSRAPGRLGCQRRPSESPVAS